MKPIILRARTSQTECIGAVRLTPEAERVVRRLSFKTGLPIRQIVSEIIIQATVAKRHHMTAGKVE